MTTANSGGLSSGAVEGLTSGDNTIINNIQLSDRFSNVSVDKIESNTTDEAGGFNFVIRANTRTAEVVTQSAREAEKTNILDRTQGFDN